MLQVLPLDVPLTYPNPLHGEATAPAARHTSHVTRNHAGNASFDEYGGSFPLYQGGEFFKFYFDARDLLPKPVQVRGVWWRCEGVKHAHAGG